ncbi:MAG: (2Fe-2S)-binding protein [Bacteroidia bacterium]|nr:(2Fe-2S)-binding protein [Bacteroidia bacterium]
MLKITVNDTDGSSKELELEVSPSTSLMEVLVENEFDVPAICGGMASCGTCHVEFVKGFDKLPAKAENEEFMLDSLPNLVDHSRLSCQCKVDESLDGAEIKILNDSF